MLAVVSHAPDYIPCIFLDIERKSKSATSSTLEQEEPQCNNWAGRPAGPFAAVHPAVLGLPGLVLAPSRPPHPWDAQMRAGSAANTAQLQGAVGVFLFVLIIYFVRSI